MKLTIVPPQGFNEHIELAHAIHQEAQVSPWKLSTFADCFTKPYYGVFAFDNDKIIGYAIMLEVVDEATLMDIAVDSGARGKGVGRALVDFVIEIMGDSFPELIDKKAHIEKVIKSEEISFSSTLERGLLHFEKILL